MPRRAATLIELLVVIGIVAVLIGLTVPAVVMVRRSAARADALARLHSLAIASANYESANRKVPGNGFKREGVPIVFFDLLPYLEAESVYYEFVRHEGTVREPPDPGVAHARVIAAYVNPSDSTSQDKALDGYGLASFTPNGSAFARGVSFADGFPDGLSNTILFGERLMMCGGEPNRWFGEGPRGMNFGASPPPENFGADRDTCQPDFVCTVAPGGICVALADGSTRQIPRAAALANWAKACGPDDGVVPEGDW